MAKKQGQKQSQSTAAGDMEGNVEQIRDILFGRQMRAYEDRFAELEERLTKTVERLSSDFEKRVERVNAYAKRELEKLAEQFKAERKERMNETRQGLKELNELTNQVESWFAEVEEQFDNESKALYAAIEEQNKEFELAMRELREAADSKIASEDLAELLGDIATRLKKSPRG